MREAEQNLEEAANFKAEEPAGQYVEGTGLKFNFESTPPPPKEKIPDHHLQIPEGMELNKEQQESINSIQWDLIGFGSTPLVMDLEMYTRGNIDYALDYYTTHSKHVESISRHIQNLPMELGMQIIDKIGPTMAKVDELAKNFTEAAKKSAMKWAEAYESAKDRPEYAALFSNRLVEIKEACAENDIDISDWEYSPEIEQILLDYPIEKQLTTFIQEQIDQFNKTPDDNSSDKTSRVNRWLKYCMCGIARRNYEEMTARGIAIPQELESAIQPLLAYYDEYWSKPENRTMGVE